MSSGDRGSAFASQIAQKHSALKRSDTSDWADVQKAAFTDWINSTLRGRGVRVNEDLYEELKDGQVLFHLMEVLSGEDLSVYGRLTRGTMRIQLIANCNVSFKFLAQHVKIVDIGPTDVVDGNPKRVLGLIWAIFVYYEVLSIPDVKNVSDLKGKILAYSDVEVNNLTSSWEDGRAFLALLNDANPSEAPYRPVSDAILNRKKAYRLGEELFGVPQLLNYQDARVFHYEQVMLTYLVELYNRLPKELDESLAMCMVYLKVMRWWRKLCRDPTWWVRLKSRRQHRLQGVGFYGRDYGDDVFGLRKGEDRKNTVYTTGGSNHSSSRPPPLSPTSASALPYSPQGRSNRPVSPLAKYQVEPLPYRRAGFSSPNSGSPRITSSAPSYDPDRWRGDREAPPRTNWNAPAAAPDYAHETSSIPAPTSERQAQGNFVAIVYLHQSRGLPEDEHGPLAEALSVECGSANSPGFSSAVVEYDPDNEWSANAIVTCAADAFAVKVRLLGADDEVCFSATLSLPALPLKSPRPMVDSFEAPRWYSSDNGNGAQISVSVAKLAFQDLATIGAEYCELHRTLRDPTGANAPTPYAGSERRV